MSIGFVRPAWLTSPVSPSDQAENISPSYSPFQSVDSSKKNNLS